MYPPIENYEPAEIGCDYLLRAPNIWGFMVCYPNQINGQSLPASEVRIGYSNLAFAAKKGQKFFCKRMTERLQTLTVVTLPWKTVYKGMLATII